MINGTHDIIIVGAGPVGCYTAYLLSKEGLNVGIFEKNSAIGKDINCTGIVSTECLKKLNLPDNVILRPVNSIKAFSPSGNFLRYQSTSPLAYVLNRGLLDHEINRMSMREGATVYFNTEVKEINITDSAFKVKVKTEGGEKEFSSMIGVIATGFELNSLGRLFNRPEDFLYGIQTDVEMKDLSDIEVYFGRKIAPGSFAWVVPTNDGLAKIGLITKKNPVAYLKGFLQNSLIMHRLDRCDNQIKCSPIPLGMIPKSYAERLIIVGEAAGQVKTTTGGGIYFGLLCSEIAAETIIKAFKKGDFSERVLEEYEIAWREKIGPELKAGLMLRGLFSTLSDCQIDLLMNLAEKDGILSIIEKASFDWHRDLITSLLRRLFSKINPF